jgi:hypothetical protein
MTLLVCIAATAVLGIADGPGVSTQAGILQDAQRLFYNGRYEEAAALTRESCAGETDDLSACELHTAALLFQVKRAIGDAEDKDKALKQCATCPDLMAAFQAALTKGQEAARARLKLHADDDETLFLLGKLDLNHVWLHLGTLGRKTGWGEYWEARRSLDKVLKRSPGHIRARVARAWIDYIVDTKMPKGTRWLLGGGNRKRGLRVVKEAAGTEAEFFVRAEARFGLWDMQVRERDIAGAVATARELARDFPDNRELQKFLEINGGVSQSRLGSSFRPHA